MSTAQDSLKEKYLQQAHQLLTRTNKPSEKPRANVEPFVHSVLPLHKTHPKKDHLPTLLGHTSLHHSDGDLLHRPPDPIISTASDKLLTSEMRHDDQSSSDISCLSCTHFEQKVKFLTEANKELKRLLVASLGNNLKLQLEQLIHEKAAMSCDLDVSLQQLADNMELVDKVSIDCDVWRSKYLASRLMIDELAGVKREVSQHLAESQRALECLLGERNKLKQVLEECEAIVRESTHHTVSTHQPVIPQSQAGTVIDLAHNTKQLVQLCYDHTHSHGGTRFTGVHTLALEPTTGERLARKVLSSQDIEVLVPLKLKGSDISRQKWRSYSPDLLLFDGGVDFHCSGCKGPLLCV